VIQWGLRVTPDTNILVSATISGRGAAAEILDAWRRGEIDLVLCEEIVAEFEDVLRRPRIQQHYRGITAETIAASAAALRRYSVLVDVSAVAQVIAEDPDDDIVLACAVTGMASHIVTRDAHLLGLRDYQGIQILPPAELLATVRQWRGTPLAPPGPTGPG
jgi:putative PIN family toxin of toxin-antitoxin system